MINKKPDPYRCQFCPKTFKTHIIAMKHKCPNTPKIKKYRRKK